MRVSIFIYFILYVIAAGCSGGKKAENKSHESAATIPAAGPAADFLMPTLNAQFPPYETISDTALLRITEEEWRQIEFISKNQRSEIDSEIVKIQDIFTHHSNNDGVYTHFSKVYMREMNVNPVGSGFEKLKSYFGKDLPLKKVVIYNHPGQVKGGFSFVANGITYYGMTENDTVKSFCIFSAESLDALKAGMEPMAGFLKKEKLLLVDWRKMKVLDEKTLREGLLGEK